MRDLDITRPDDWHIHLRDGALLKRTVPDAAQYCARALVMPNLDPPVATVAQAERYRAAILAALPGDQRFEPLMTLYLNEDTQADEIARAARDQHIQAFKLYPAHATTGSRHGVSDTRKIYPLLERMQREHVILSVHAESVAPEVDVFDREAHFLEHALAPIVSEFPELKIVVEHISTAAAVEFVRAQRSGVAATITVHHLLYHRNHLLAGVLRPHYYCAPVLKRDSDRMALRAAATSGEERFFLGTDSAPHGREDKESDCGCAGCYTACSALSDYAQVFEQENALDRLEHFASFAGADFYGVARNSDTVTLRKQEWQLPQTISAGNTTIVPLGAGELRQWCVAPSRAGVH